MGEHIGGTARNLSPVVAYQTLAGAIQARQLQTELADAEWVEESESPSRAAPRLARFGYDQAPVRRDGALEGYVVTAELEKAGGRQMAELIRPLGPSAVVSGTGSVLDLIEAFRAGAPLMFVIDGRAVTGFVTPSDLNKHPARAHFYLLLSGLEMTLAAGIRALFPDQKAAVALLAPDDQGRVLNRFRRDQRNNVEVDLVTGMDLEHLLTVAGSSDSLRRMFGVGNRDAWHERTSELTGIRNAVMHPVLEFLGRQRTVDDLARVERQVLVMLEHASQAGN
jgi:hypothetical protein